MQEPEEDPKLSEVKAVLRRLQRISLEAERADAAPVALPEPVVQPAAEPRAAQAALAPAAGRSEPLRPTPAAAHVRPTPVAAAGAASPADNSPADKQLSSLSRRQLSAASPTAGERAEPATPLRPVAVPVTTPVPAQVAVSAPASTAATITPEISSVRGASATSAGGSGLLVALSTGVLAALAGLIGYGLAIGWFEIGDPKPTSPAKSVVRSAPAATVEPVAAKVEPPAARADAPIVVATPTTPAQPSPPAHETSGASPPTPPSAESERAADTSAATTAATPAPTPPPAPAPQAPADEETVLRTARNLLEVGRVRDARAALLARAESDTASAEVALLLGRTFDPSVLRALPSPDAEPSVQDAERWYRAWHERAVAQGLVQDTMLIDRLLRQLR